MIMQFGPFTLDGGTRRLIRDHTEIHLTPKALDLLTILAEEAPRVVPKAELHERLWTSTFVSDAALVSVVKELRRALKHDGEDDTLIRTAHGVGYALDAPVDRAGAHASSLQHWVNAADQKFTLHAGDNVIGRGHGSDVLLDLSTVSREHARVRISGSQALLEDLKSKNGTTIEGKRVTRPVLLKDGACIGIGSVSVVYRTSSANTATATDVLVESSSTVPGTRRA